MSLGRDTSYVILDRAESRLAAGYRPTKFSHHVLARVDEVIE
jgi:hypothetical protein